MIENVILFVVIGWTLCLTVFCWYHISNLFTSYFSQKSFENRNENYIDCTCTYSIPPQPMYWTSELKTIRKSKGKRKQYIPRYIKQKS